MRKIKLLLFFLFCFQVHIANAEEIAQNWQNFPTSQQNQSKFEFFDSKSFLYPMIHGGLGVDFGSNKNRIMHLGLGGDLGFSAGNNNYIPFVGLMYNFARVAHYAEKSCHYNSRGRYTCSYSKREGSSVSYHNIRIRTGVLIPLLAKYVMLQPLASAGLYIPFKGSHLDTKYNIRTKLSTAYAFDVGVNIVATFMSFGIYYRHYINMYNAAKAKKSSYGVFGINASFVFHQFW